MPRKRIAFLLLMIFTFSSITGCWSRREIETLAFVTVIGIDKDGAGAGVTVTCQIALPQGGGPEGSGGEDSPAWTVTGRGETIGQAVFNLTRYVGKKIFLSHVQVIIVGEEQAKAGLNEVVDFFSRTPQLRGTHWLAVAKGKASDIMQVEPKLNTMPAFYLEELFKNARENSIAPAVNWLQFQRQIVSPDGGEGFTPVLHKINAEEGTKEEFSEDKSEPEDGATSSKQEGGNKAPGEALSLEQTAVFKNNKLVGWLNNDETRGLLWIRGEVTRGIITLEKSELGEGKVTTFPTFANRRIVIEPKGDSVKVDIFISQEGNLSEQTLNNPIANPKDLKILNEEMAAKIKGQAEAALFKLQKQFQADITSISYQVRAQQPELAEKLNWEKEFPNAEINVHVSSHIRRTGTTMWPIYIERPWEEKTNYQELPLAPQFE